MAVWDITLANRTGSKIDVMVFQTVPEGLFMNGSYFAAWKVLETPNPGNIRLELPKTFEFYVIEPGRNTGPFPVKYGDEVNISQPAAASPPTVNINSNENIPKDRIKVMNLKGNAQPLEMALFKKDSKMVFYKDVVPNAFVFMAIKPSVYMSVVSGIKEGQEFETNTFLGHKNKMVGYSVPVEFKFLDDKPHMDIHITRKLSGEYVFTQK